MYTDLGEVDIVLVVVITGLSVLAALAVLIGRLDRWAQAVAWRKLGAAQQQNLLQARTLHARLHRDEGDLEMR